MKIGVFCSANNQIDADYFRLTEELGAWIAREGHSVVYGGCNCGLMETIGKAVHDGGQMAIGVIPRIVEKGGRVSSSVDIGPKRRADCVAWWHRNARRSVHCGSQSYDRLSR